MRKEVRRINWSNKPLHHGGTTTWVQYIQSDPYFMSFFTFTSLINKYTCENLVFLDDLKVQEDSGSKNIAQGWSQLFQKCLFATHTFRDKCKHIHLYKIFVQYYNGIMIYIHTSIHVYFFILVAGRVAGITRINGTNALHLEAIDRGTLQPSYRSYCSFPKQTIALFINEMRFVSL